MQVPHSLIYTLGADRIDARHRGHGPTLDDYKANAALIVWLRNNAEALMDVADRTIAVSGPPR